MGSSPEMERFGVSDADYEYMMNPLGRHSKVSKKKQIYGVFASDDSDSDQERSGFGGRDAGFKRKGANYSAPISFVSGGVKLGSSNNTTNEEEKSDQISDDDEDNALKNLGSYGDSDSDSSSDARVRRKDRRQMEFSVGAGRRAAVAAAASKSNTSGFGAWERHTKGIGMKLLEQMGYEPGKGLGSEGQGIVTPVQAVQRTGKVAVGYFGSEKVEAPRRGNEPSKDVEENESTGPRYKKKPGANSKLQPLKPAYEYKTADEIVASLCPSTPAAVVKRHGLFLENSEMSKVKVIDMTSKEQKIYTSYEAALSRSVRGSHKPGDSSILYDEGPDSAQKRIEKRLEGQFFDCPVLKHNLSLVLRSTEDSIRKLDRASRFEEDRAVGLEHEIEKLTETVKTETDQVKQLKIALDLIESFEKDMSNSKTTDSCMSADTIASWMSRIRSECSNLSEMPILMAAVARPMLDSSLAKWKPLKDPSFCLDLLSRWKDYFQNSLAFDVVLESSWLNALRRTIVSDWDPRDCESLLDVLEAWRSLLPEEMLQSRILDQLISPKLQEAVSSWNPLTDTIPIHTWLHPWLPWFGDTERLAPVHDTVLQKLGTCLSNWHPSDASAHSILLPWRSVFSVASMSSFLSRHVIPKLGIALQQFQLNPANQNMDPWNWVMRWADLIGPAAVVNLLDHYFWSRWLSVLANWLRQGVEARQRGDHTGAGQIYQEVGRWYAGWKGQLPPECMEYANVKEALTKALAMMERAMRGLPPQEQSTSIRMPTNSTNYPIRPTVPQTFGPTIPIVAPPPLTLRKQIEQVASQRGFVFHPIPNRTYEGQQVYRLESLQVFFDRNVSFVFNPTDGSWHPVTFAELMSRVQY